MSDVHLHSDNMLARALDRFHSPRDLVLNQNLLMLVLSFTVWRTSNGFPVLSMDSEFSGYEFWER